MPVAPRQRPALETRRFETQQQRQQDIGEQHGATANAEFCHGNIGRRHQHEPADQRQP
jgi:hypothetical protein